MSVSPTVAPAGASSLEEFYAALAPLHLGAGWNKPTPSLYPAPYKQYQPAVWHYRDARPALAAAGTLIDTALAERRNLILVNPLEGNTYNTSATLVSAYQMLLPGEHARSHRHSPNAWRLVLEADRGAYTTVDGARLPMGPGDVVLTPNWMWHGHGHEGAAPAYWIDYLDIPLVRVLEPMFFEDHPQGFEHGAPAAESSPLVFPAAEIRARLAVASADPDGRFGRQIRLDAPQLKTASLSVCALDAGTATKPFQTTANNIYSVVSGRGTTVVDGLELPWEFGDVFVAPAWRPHHHRPAQDSVLFRVTDEPLFAALGWLRVASA